ncbi:MAG: lysophospholipid acyltransferase family protein [Armatimonadota bacterium]
MKGNVVLNRKKSREELKIRLSSFLARTLIKVLGRTCRIRVTGFEHVRELVESGKGFIMAVWHGRTMLPVYYCRGMGIWAITSLSRDGEIQTRIVTGLGYKTIRGSTGRGAVRAALAGVKKLEEGGILAITPDGPKGPANQVQEGIAFLAQRANCAIVPIGVGMRPRKLMPTWDSYALPLPFAKIHIVFGNPLYLTEETLVEQSAQIIIKDALDRVQWQAQNEVREGC